LIQIQTLIIIEKEIEKIPVEKAMEMLKRGMGKCQSRRC